MNALQVLHALLLPEAGQGQAATLCLQHLEAGRFWQAYNSAHKMRMHPFKLIKYLVSA